MWDLLAWVMSTFISLVSLLGLEMRGNVLAVLQLLATARQFTICGSDSCLFLGWFV
jgi:hypothetical protein